MARTLARTSSTSRGCQELLQNAVSLILSDEGFSLPTKPATDACMCAQKFLKWMSSNKQASSTFAKSIIKSLLLCFPERRSARMTREKMWQNYYQLRSSDDFVESWSEELKMIECSACPIFFQFVTDKLMEFLITEHFPLGLQVQCASVDSLDYEEVCALRYTAGYVIHSLQKKANKLAHPLKKEILLCLLELAENNEHERMHFSESWVDLVDRGGLVHVSDTTFMLFASMEVELRSHLHASGVTASAGVKEKAMESIAENENVLAHWSELSANWREEEANRELLKMIITHWVTVRGFSFASDFMEAYKQKNKKTVQKSKGLRKTLIGQGSKVAISDEGDVNHENSSMAVA